MDQPDELGAAWGRLAAFLTAFKGERSALGLSSRPASVYAFTSALYMAYALPEPAGDKNYAEAAARFSDDLKRLLTATGR